MVCPPPLGINLGIVKPNIATKQGSIPSLQGNAPLFYFPLVYHGTLNRKRKAAK